jgi:hypothetical protein
MVAASESGIRATEARFILRTTLSDEGQRALRQLSEIN